MEMTRDMRYTYQCQAKKNMEVKYDLPSAIVEEILALLPIKSIIRFRSVSKRWSSSLVSVEFHKLRSRLAPPQLRCQKFVEANRLERRSSLTIAQYNQGDLITQTSLYFTFQRPDTHATIVGSCHGLVCVLLDKYVFKDLVLWNPSTGVCRRLPNHEDTSPEYHVSAYGFGHDSVSHDYKIFALSTDKHATRTETQVFSLRANSWKKIKTDKHFVWRRGLYVNGALHWDNNAAEQVIAFHLGREEFYHVPLPAPEALHPRGQTSMGIVGDYLCMSSPCAQRWRNREIWIMKEYGVKASWVPAIALLVPKEDCRVCQDWIPQIIDNDLIPKLIDNDGKISIKYDDITLEIVDIGRKKAVTFCSCIVPFAVDLTSPYIVSETTG